MAITNIYLTDLEQKALSLLAEDKSYEAVKRECGLTSHQISRFMDRIRKKTGIENTKNVQQVRAYLEKYAKAISGPGPTEQQLEALQRVLGVRYPEQDPHALSYRMGLGSVFAGLQLFEDALNAAGIFATTVSEAKAQGRIYLSYRNSMAKALPLTENHEAVLHLYAQGHKTHVIAEMLGEGFSEDYVDLLIHQGALRLGAISRGRGVQRRLVGIALAHRAQREKNAQKAVITMADPAF